MRVVNGYYSQDDHQYNILLSHFHNTYVNETTVYETRINGILAHTASSEIDEFIQFIQSTAL